uniref:Uncharacterized protein n=1 Tax=Rhodosorus marinus TaxID=101924 RepID=A0A7S2ZQQ2_9RHOD|mmetsp:Transcript_25582/g.101012  ORF Transcript_25582/g.101012 Transcript_25582/m.101012 type:complete len:150 (+) Transcript_25582:1011-1460(+)
MCGRLIPSIYCHSQQVVLVNSRFTASMFEEAFKSLRSVPMVVHPSVQLAENDDDYADDFQPDELIVLSLNRYERKKNVEIAIDALGKTKGLIPTATFAKVKLVIAGGWDARLAENREYELELQELASSLYGKGTKALNLSNTPSCISTH